jgi:hypothetical protein
MGVAQDFLESCCGTTCEKRELYDKIKKQEDELNGNDRNVQCFNQVSGYGLIYSFVASLTM